MKPSLQLTTPLIFLMSSILIKVDASTLHQPVALESHISTLEVRNSQILARKIPRIPVTPNRLTAALSNFKQRKFKVGSREYVLGSHDLRHILKRHHPRYWDGTSKTTQTFLNKSMTVNDVVNGIETVVRKNRAKLSGPPPYIDLGGEYGGVDYILDVDYNRRIRQFYPKP